MQIVNAVIREAMGRSPADRVQGYCVIDEAGRFATDDVTEVLDQGGGFKLSLFLAHQHCSQLQKGDDTQFLDSVLTNTHLKFVGGGLTQDDMKKIGDTIYRHHLDPDKPFLATATKRQLQKVVQVTSLTDAVQEAHAHTGGRVSTDGISSGTARRRSANAGDDAGISTTVDPVTGLPTVTTSARRSAGSAEGDDESEGTSHAESVIGLDTDSVARSKAKTTGPAVHPTEVFEEFQPEPLDTQQHRFNSKTIRQAKRHFMSAVMKNEPVGFSVADVPDTEFSPGQITYLNQQLAERNRELYSSPAEIDAMGTGRLQRLLSYAVVVEDDPAAAQLSPAAADPFLNNEPLPPPVHKKSLRSKSARGNVRAGAGERSSH
jgi:hypothetical protein